MRGKKARRVRLLEEMERNLEGFAQSVKAVMKQAERGGLTGIHGPVSRLVQAGPAYALAVETALGAAAQNLVCDREEDAKEAIRYLKETKGGRATFLPLTAVKGNTLGEKGLENEPGFVGLASSLVEADPQYEVWCAACSGAPPLRRISTPRCGLPKSTATGSGSFPWTARWSTPAAP